MVYKVLGRAQPYLRTIVNCRSIKIFLMIFRTLILQMSTPDLLQLFKRATEERLQLDKQKASLKTSKARYDEAVKLLREPLLQKHKTKAEANRRSIADVYRREMRPLILTEVEYQHLLENEKLGTDEAKAQNNVILQKVRDVYKKIINDVYKDEEKKAKKEEDAEEPLFHDPVAHSILAKRKLDQVIGHIKQGDISSTELFHVLKKAVAEDDAEKFNCFRKMFGAEEEED
jgi:hypothetical protein